MSTAEDAAKARLVRSRSRLLTALGDCAVGGNVPALRNSLATEEVLELVYVSQVDLRPGIPAREVPLPLEQSLPLHQVIAVDLFLPGCPPRRRQLPAPWRRYRKTAI